jgi:hypothetical protein
MNHRTNNIHVICRKANAHIYFYCNNKEWHPGVTPGRKATTTKFWLNYGNAQKCLDKLARSASLKDGEYTVKTFERGIFITSF